MGFATLLLLTHLFFTNQYPHFSNPNSTSRIYTTLALIDDGTFSIDGPIARHEDTVDKAEFDGRFYSDKPPGLSVALTPLAWLLRRTLIPLEELSPMHTALRVLGLTLPIVVFWCLTLRFYSELGGRRELAIAGILSAALGSSFFIYAGALFSGAAAGSLLFLSFLALRGAQTSERAPWLAFGAGLLAGTAFSVDFVVMPGVVVLAAASLLPDRRDITKTVLFSFGVAAVLLIWMAHNYAIFEHPLRVGFHYHANSKYESLYQSGFMGMQLPSLEALVGLSFSPARGLFFLSPALLFAFPGWLRLWREHGLRWEALVSCSVFLSILLFASTTIEWQGGWSIGARYIVPGVPFLLVGVVGALREREPSSAVFFAFAALSTVGVGAVALATMTITAFPYVFENPVYSLTVPLLAAGLHVESLILPESMSDLVIPLYSLVALAAASFIAWNVMSTDPRRKRTAPLACVVGAIGMLGLSQIPEDPGRLAVRHNATAWAMQAMGSREDAVEWLNARRMEERAGAEEQALPR